ncbi:hypothetical protein WNY37_15525 [Henriciella sp. AS95]|uniref:hypothetical protein n=1 Tax=Henriciella sp. AS95 TaxID=3135782 RepID=UPI00317450B0
MKKANCRDDSWQSSGFRSGNPPGKMINKDDQKSRGVYIILNAFCALMRPEGLQLKGWSDKKVWQNAFGGLVAS